MVRRDGPLGKFDDLLNELAISDQPRHAHWMTLILDRFWRSPLALSLALVFGLFVGSVLAQHQYELV